MKNQTGIESSKDWVVRIVDVSPEIFVKPMDNFRDRTKLFSLFFRIL